VSGDGNPTHCVGWKTVVELIGQLAVVVSLVYVGVQVEQNTRAIQTETGQSLYLQGIERVVPVVESPEVADMIVRATRAPETMSAADSLRYHYFLNLQLNEFEAAYTSMRQGTLDAELGRGWLENMGPWSCRADARRYWDAVAVLYSPDFRAALDSAIATVRCASS
jgi:hypothetical protein